MNTQDIQAICFDLDDSLWAIAPVIIRAEKLMHAYMADYFPAVTEKYDEHDIREVRMAMSEQYPHLSHDLTALRQISIETMLEESGYERHHAEHLMQMFLDLRHDVEFFPDVLPALEQLASRFRLYAISNGNADVSRLGMGEWFEGQVSARSEGFGKPDVRIFHAAARNLDLDPGEILHVGDHPVDDVSGALNAGLYTAWLNRIDAEWGESFAPHHEIRNLDELVDLLMD